MKMSLWPRRMLGLLFIYGGVSGLMGVQGLLASGTPHGIIATCLIELFNVAAIGIGVLVIEGRQCAVVPCLSHLLLQVPMFTSPWLTYSLMTGMGAWGVYGQDGLQFRFLLGAHFDLGMLSGDPWRIGLNFASLALFVLVGRAERDA